MNTLHAPWRMDYIRSLENSPHGKDDGCFLCRDAGCTPDRFAEFGILWQSTHCLCVINRFPYTNGHLLIAPRAHKPELEDLSHEELLDLQAQTVRAVAVLKKAISPQGFNIGINLGRCAGAGLPGHLHQHVVPRWNGDVNFMAVVGEVRIVPQALSQLWVELTRVAAEVPVR